MYSRFYFILFVVPIIYTASASVPHIDQDILEDIFGPVKYVGSASTISQVNQAVAVTPANDSVVELQEIEDNDHYSPPAIDYDIFDWALTKRVASSSSKNFLISPLGLKLALAILTEAATGPTRTELTAVLNFELDKNVTRHRYSSIVGSLKTSSTDYILNLGNRIYLEQSIVPKQRFAAAAEQFYDTHLKRLDFSEPIAASKEINDWVSSVTHGRITNLVDHDDLSNAVILILNTLFFKGTWRYQFSPNATKPGTFYVSPNEPKEVPMMRIKERFYYVETTKFDAKILRMPYLGKKFAMYIVVPNSLTGLANVLNGLSDLQTEMDFLKERMVNVILPRFNFDYTSTLDEVLKEMGIRLLFEDTANLSGISRGQGLKQRLKVSRVLQRSGIEVNELGSVAYSATEISLVNKFGEDDDVTEEVLANKPFLFFIQDEGTRQLLFTGRVTDPLILDGCCRTSLRSCFYQQQAAPIANFLCFVSIKIRRKMLYQPFIQFFQRSSFLLAVKIRYRSFILVGFSIVIIFITLQCLRFTNGQRSDLARLNFFDIDLLRYSAEDRKGNVIFSPASIKSTLAMVLEGAKGATATEIRNALRLSSIKVDFRNQLYSYLKALQSNSSDVTLTNANSVFVSDKLNLTKEYEHALKYVYLSDIHKISFSDPILASKFINNWVRNNTKGLIPSIVEPVNLEPSSQILITNALYFKSIWKHAFDRTLTRGMCFYESETCKTVAMMDLQAELNYAYVDNLRAHAVELPYMGERYSMILLVPQDRQGAIPLIRDLPYMSLSDICKAMAPTDVQLFMPKFTIDYSEDMISALRGMRIVDLFSKKSNLTGMFVKESPQINGFVHKVHISVDETGTIAAAASSAFVVPLISDGIQLRVDRPFLFFIKDNNLGIVLFEGKVDDPIPYVAPNHAAPEPAKDIKLNGTKNNQILKLKRYT
ncbi:uncharacterized protein LOC131852124 [Achroia grisella]|uniref:uncharacterized protein LOC131852124 n=1 Tax=Achroia grisella TaxID=688607 RepID=UPI0027D2024B|nr:uncharacterized protein LOC131852124 [Achroia grisella]